MDPLLRLDPWSRSKPSCSGFWHFAIPSTLESGDRIRPSGNLSRRAAYYATIDGGRISGAEVIDNPITKMLPFGSNSGSIRKIVDENRMSTKGPPAGSSRNCTTANADRLHGQIRRASTRVLRQILRPKLYHQIPQTIRSGDRLHRRLRYSGSIELLFNVRFMNVQFRLEDVNGTPGIRYQPSDALQKPSKSRCNIAKEPASHIEGALD